MIGKSPFEAGAIAKILNLDDDVLKIYAYYPYDLVHIDGKGSNSDKGR